MRRVLTATLAALAAVAMQAAPVRAQLQLGLRLDAVASVQWSGSKIWFEGDGRTVVQTTARRIDDLWPGPARGAWGVSTADGVGILLGRDVAIGGPVGGRSAIVRSSRYDAIWSLTGDARRSEIVEHRSGLQRTVARVDRRLTDFDVDLDGRIVGLGGDTLVFIVGTDRQARLALPAVLRGATRVFVDAELAEVAVYAPGRLGRYAVATGTWQYEDVAEQQDALVRHAWTRRIGVEPRFR